MPDDAQLLRQYAETRSEEAFAELVRRHLGWVYRAAIRRTGGRIDLAQDVAQYVFILLARKASTLSGRKVLGGWLYTTTRYAASQLVRSEASRRNYESAAAMNLLNEPLADHRDELRPNLDKVLDRLPQREREAIFLRFFEEKSFGEIGKILSLGEDGARKRVERALERLSSHLGRLGITSTSAALAGLLTGEGAIAAPAEVMTATMRASLSGAVPVGSSVGLIHLMVATKTTWSAAALIGFLGLAALSTSTVGIYEATKASAKSAATAAAMDQYRSDNEMLRSAEQRAEAAAAQLTALKTQADAARKLATASTLRQEHADGVAFLAAYGQAKPILFALWKAKREHANAPLFKQLGMTHGQLESFSSAQAQHYLDTIVLMPGGGIGQEETDLPDDQARAILGDSGLRAYKDFTRAQAAQSWADSIAQNAAEYGAPLSMDQVTALAQAVTASSPDYASGRPVNLVAVDWAKALAQAKQNLTDAQWTAAEPRILMSQFSNQVQALAQPGKTDR